MSMKTIKFSRGHTLESFDKGISDIGQFNSNDHKLLKKLVKEGVLIHFKKQWYPGLGKLRNSWIKANSPEVLRFDNLLLIK